MNKSLKYILIAVVIGLLGYKSIYIKKLSEVTQTGKGKFDAVAFVEELWQKKMPAKIDNAVELQEMIRAVSVDKDAGLKKYTNLLGIGNYRYALIKAQAAVNAVHEDEVLLQLQGAGRVLPAILATEYIYGNAIRDASELVDLNNFPNTTELNNISEEMNKIVRTTVLPSFKSTVKKGDTLNITAAIELNKEHLKWDGLELLPVRVQIVN